MTRWQIIKTLGDAEVSYEELAQNILALEDGRILLAWWSGKVWWVDLPGDKIEVLSIDHLKNLCHTLM